MKDSDFCQALLNCALKTHCDTIIEDEVLVEQIKKLNDLCEKQFMNLENKVGHNACMASYFTGVQLMN